MRKKSLLAAAMVPFLWGCENTTGPEGGGQVAVRFQAVAPARSSAQLSRSQVSFDHVPAAGAITLTGTNGTLVIQDLQLIVAELELKRSGVECLREEDEDGCEKFEDGPFLVSPLNGRADEVVNAVIPAGSYTELEFEVEDLDDDDDNDRESPQARQAVLAEIRKAYPLFPRNASMVAHGTFNGQPFTVYFEAEIEVEQEFETPFRVPEDGVITVNLDPAGWFQQGSRVMDLAALNGRTIEFEAEFENGIGEMEFDD